jgi:NAD(P)-dependent dehydrogenase (short-subunit alcohol dehydrogenase family)
MDLAGRRIILTGGARGIGAAVVRAYVAAGAQVAAMDVLDEAGEAVVAEANRTGPGKASYRHCDIASRPVATAAFKSAVDEMGGLDVMVNVAGVERRTPAELVTDEEWTWLFEINARGTFITNQLAFGYMRETGGQIINFGSNAGAAGVPGLAHYGATKGAVLAWTRTVAKEWGRYGISVNAIAPGMWTPMYEGSRATMNAEQLAEHDKGMARAIPLGGRLGDPDKDLAPMMVFMATEGARFITGQTLAVDGGLLMVR